MDDTKIKRVIKEYIKRMAENYKTKKGVSTDKQIDCPKCGLHRGMEFMKISGIWRCLSVDCDYKFPSEITPPNPFEFDEIMKLKERLDFIEKNREMLD